MAEGIEAERLYVGVDVGGTKIQASLVRESGSVAARERRPTPRDGDVEGTLAVIRETVEAVVADGPLAAGDLAGVGLAIPGVVDPRRGHVVVTPNMNLSGVDVVAPLEAALGVPVVLGNDCNLGTLGEVWLGAARGAQSAFGILVGTGIGGGFVQKTQLWRGHRESASEIGHVVMEIGGPECGCGNRGCLEALASRTAIERDIRQAVDEGRNTALSERLDGDLSRIRSGALRDALAAGDGLVTEVMSRASEVLGHACLTVRHLLDPEVIVLGGGVIEACGDFMFPIVRRIVEGDRLPGARQGAEVRVSALGDDAVAVGAVAMARLHVGRSPFKKRFERMPVYPEIGGVSFGQVTVGGEAYDRDVYIRVNGKVKKRRKGVAKRRYGTSHRIGPEELEKVCKGAPEVVFIGTGHSGQAELTSEGETFLSQRSIACEAMPTAQAAEAYNRCERRKAALIHVTC